jgi:purine-nucleoside/S-methyl-5'-thioadenosine phosphorylase / adenosine deaminase
VKRADRDIAVVDGAISCELPDGGRALFTTRARGNLSILRGDGHERGREARERLCEDLALRRLCASRQVHGTVVRRVHHLDGAGGQPLAVDADGHATALSGVGMTVLVADCLPVALGAGGAVAMLHAGWRGLAAGVIEQGVGALAELSGGREEIVAVIGPGAGVCCYEVGPKVHAAFGGAHRGGGHLDLRSIARQRLLGAGVAHVRDVRACTICDERFFSHRREGARAGRQAGVAWRS